ncbi:hypothetical protein BpHYR1_019735 [Brachionus plicatilis]|uniref:Uncharacterized protein n=1 Tax=Brachionus plicatilis TaxID=10195 RepID=A0A3M7PGH8_BRAPC|nr:hypothetical protein BpHYR1_019735 [Brachionus plicatilis]
MNKIMLRNSSPRMPLRTSIWSLNLLTTLVVRLGLYSSLKFSLIDTKSQSIYSLSWKIFIYI